MGREPNYVVETTLEKIPFDFQGIHIKDENLVGEIALECDAYVVAIGGLHGKRRHETAEMLKQKYSLRNLHIIHHTAYFCSTASYDEGCMFMPRSILHTYSKIGKNCILNTGSIIDHECDVGNGVHVMVGAVVAGGVTIEDFATIGSNATILPNLTIGKGAIVGAGAVVTKDVKDSTIVTGVPAAKYVKR